MLKVIDIVRVSYHDKGETKQWIANSIFSKALSVSVSRTLPSVQYQDSASPASWPCLRRQFCSWRLLMETNQPPYREHSSTASDQLRLVSEKRYR